MSASWNNAFAPKDETKDAVLIGLLGAGIKESRTPRMHMSEAKALGLNCDYRLIDTDDVELPLEVDPLLTRLNQIGYAGINVTFPYKQSVMTYLDTISESAQKVGAVNTVLFRDGKRIGENTDSWGFSESMSVGLPDAPKTTVLLIGAGGAGAAVGAALIKSGAASLLIHDKDTERATALAARLGTAAEVVSDVVTACAEADGIINATPVGMAKLPGMPLPAELIEARHWVGDVVYFPLETELLACARNKGCQILSGAGMALYQAVRAFELFTGKKPDVKRMWNAFQASG